VASGKNAWCFLSPLSIRLIHYPSPKRPAFSASFSSRTLLRGTSPRNSAIRSRFPPTMFFKPLHGDPHKLQRTAGSPSSLFTFVQKCFDFFFAGSFSYRVRTGGAPRSPNAMRVSPTQPFFDQPRSSAKRIPKGQLSIPRASVTFQIDP